MYKIDTKSKKFAKICNLSIGRENKMIKNKSLKFLFLKKLLQNNIIGMSNEKAVINFIVKVNSILSPLDIIAENKPWPIALCDVISTEFGLSGSINVPFK